MIKSFYRLYDVCSNRIQLKVSMILEYLDMDLYRLMRNHPLLMPANPHLVKYYMWQLLQGIDHCHRRRCGRAHCFIASVRYFNQTEY